MRSEGTLPTKDGTAEQDRANLVSVSIVIINLNGLRHLQDCFSSLLALDYPQDKLELILVDNGSVDGSLAFMQDHFPSVRVIATGTNLGFAPANTLGAREAKGDYIAFLNNDTRVDPAWLGELVAPLGQDPAIVCVAAKLLNWAGDALDFAGGNVNFYGHAFQIQPKAPVTDWQTYGSECDLLFACGGAMLIRRDVYLASGGFDDDYFAYFEDVDLGWRLWLLGYRVVFAPRAITYHRSHGTAERFAAHQLRVLYERNALYTIYKNLSDDYLARIFPGALLLLIKKALIYSGLNVSAYAIAPEASKDEQETVNRLGLSHLLAVDAFVKHLPQIAAKRRLLQQLRQRSDNEIFALVSNPFEPNSIDPGYLEEQRLLVKELGIAELFTGRQEWIGLDFAEIQQPLPPPSKEAELPPSSDSPEETFSEYNVVKPRLDLANARVKELENHLDLANARLQELENHLEAIKNGKMMRFLTMMSRLLRR